MKTLLGLGLVIATTLRTWAPAAVAAAAGPGPELIRNGGFEEAFSPAGVGAHWADNSAWAPVAVQYRDAVAAAHGGGHAQQIDCPSFKGGAVQFIQYEVPVVRGGIYRVSFWLKGQIDSPVEFLLRKAGAPYTTFASCRAVVTARWTRHEAELVADETDPAAMFIVRFTATGTVWLDDVSCHQVGTRSIAVTLHPPATVIPATFFGQHLHRNNPQLPWPAVPFGALRLWDARVSWPQLEPARGRWEFARLDQYLDSARDHQVEVLLPLGLSPTWASARPGERSAYNSANVARDLGWAAEPRDFPDWDAYVRAVATHCQGRVRQYEVWNEPNMVAFYSGTVDQLAELTRRATRILKEVDPATRVVTPSIVGDALYLDQFLTKGGARGADIIGFHFYVWPGPPEKMVPEILRVKATLARHGLAHWPLWNTEAGWNIEAKVSPPPAAAYEGRRVSSSQEAGEYIARAYILNWAAGVERYYFYAWDNGLMGLVEKDGTLKSAAHAYAAVAGWLVGARMESCAADEAGTWTARLVRPGGARVTIAWNPDQETTLRPPAVREATRVRDLAGGERTVAPGQLITISPSPVLIE